MRWFQKYRLLFQFKTIEVVYCRRSNIRLPFSLVIFYIFQSIGGESPRNVLDPFSDIFLAMNKHHFELTSHVLKSMESQEGFPSAHAKEKDKAQFRTRILK